MNRWRDWWKQAEADLRHAKVALKAGSFEWACFASQQSAEKALKAVFENRGVSIWGHSVFRMLEALKEEVSLTEGLETCAKILDKHYIPTRYPNGLAEGCPAEFYTKEEAERAICCAEEVLRFCHSLLFGQRKG